MDLEIQSRSSVRPFGPVYLRNQEQEFLEISHQYEVPYRLTFDDFIFSAITLWRPSGGFLGSKMPQNAPKWLKMTLLWTLRKIGALDFDETR